MLPNSRLLWLPIALYIIIIIPILVFDLDWHLAHFWYQIEGTQWLLRTHWLTQGVIHKLGHHLSVGLYVGILLLYLSSFKYEPLKKYKQGLAYLSISLPAATLTVSLFKRITTVDCPWSVIDFGGVRPYQSWLHSLWSPIQGADHCFPSGHASSAFMFFGVYFFCRHYWPRKATAVLCTIIVFGLIYGFAQQLRGAHFISHDISSAFVCWMMCLFIWKFKFKY